MFDTQRIKDAKRKVLRASQALDSVKESLCDLLEALETLEEAIIATDKPNYEIRFNEAMDGVADCVDNCRDLLYKVFEQVSVAISYAEDTP
ncbi:MAG: hypothetical protein QXS68_02970 [Candidatus Methanomethylicaceae archaeon]